ncbi:MAG: hypothetical protein QOD04_3733, partial [Pseudonocardiales bacterium]|nr:hypothetical protein [Pseudonocardiales bacterium]
LFDDELSDHAVATATVKIMDIALRRPTLDEVFLSLTGHRADGENTA